MKQEKVHDFFHYGSRLTMVLPIIIIILAIVFKPEKTQTLSQVASNTVVPTTISPRPTIFKGKPTPTTPKTPVDIKGPTVCTFTNESPYKGMLYIKNKMIYGDVQEKESKKFISVVLKEDCVYKWEKGTLTGTKICGFTKYMDMLEKMSSIGILTAENLMQIIAEYSNKSYAAYTTSVDSCKKETISDTVFRIPSNIQFQQKSINSLK